VRGKYTRSYAVYVRQAYRAHGFGAKAQGTYQSLEAACARAGMAAARLSLACLVVDRYTGEDRLLVYPSGEVRVG